MPWNRIASIAGGLGLLLVLAIAKRATVRRARQQPSPQMRLAAISTTTAILQLFVLAYIVIGIVDIRLTLLAVVVGLIGVFVQYGLWRLHSPEDHPWMFSTLRMYAELLVTRRRYVIVLIGVMIVFALASDAILIFGFFSQVRGKPHNEQLPELFRVLFLASVVGLLPLSVNSGWVLGQQTLDDWTRARLFLTSMIGTILVWIWAALSFPYGDPPPSYRLQLLGEPYDLWVRVDILTLTVVCVLALSLPFMRGVQLRRGEAQRLARTRQERLTNIHRILTQAKSSTIPKQLETEVVRLRAERDRYRDRLVPPDKWLFQPILHVVRDEPFSDSDLKELNELASKINDDNVTKDSQSTEGEPATESLNANDPPSSSPLTLETLLDSFADRLDNSSINILPSLVTVLNHRQDWMSRMDWRARVDELRCLQEAIRVRGEEICPLLLDMANQARQLRLRTRWVRWPLHWAARWLPNAIRRANDEVGHWLSYVEELPDKDPRWSQYFWLDDLVTQLEHVQTQLTTLDYDKVATYVSDRAGNLENDRKRFAEEEKDRKENKNLLVRFVLPFAVPVTMAILTPVIQDQLGLRPPSR